MEVFLTLLQRASPYLLLPNLPGILAWLAGFGLLILLLWIGRNFQSHRPASSAAAFFVLVLLTLATALLFGVRVPLDQVIPIPGVLDTKAEYFWMLLSAIPWVLSAGIFGPSPTMLLSLLTGLLLSVFDSHNPFHVIEYGLLGAVLGFALQQKYRTPFFGLLRRPIAASLLLALLFPATAAAGIFFWQPADLTQKLDYALATIPMAWQGFFWTVIIAGVVGELAAVVLPDAWGVQEPLVPSPAEKSIETRSFYFVGAVVAVVVLILGLLGWNVAYDSAEGMVRTRMTGAAALAAENVPFALEIGQDIIVTASLKSEFSEFEGGELDAALAAELAASPYFNRLLLADRAGRVLAAAPPGTDGQVFLTQQEEAAASLAGAGVPFQYYSYVPEVGDTDSQITFIVPVPGGDRVLIGRTALEANPFIAPLITSLDNLKDISGEGLLLDENGVILYHPDSQKIQTQFEADLSAGPGFFIHTGPDGSRNLIYLQTALGRAWMVLMSVPLRQIQQQAFSIASPLIGGLLALSLALVILLRLSLRFVTASLRKLSDQAARIAEDNRELGTPLVVEGIDEVGRMRGAFERMRASLKARMDEQDLLMKVSDGVASNLEMGQAVVPILRAALSKGGVSARVVLAPGALPHGSPDRRTVFDLGPERDSFAYLDSQILESSRTAPLIVMNHPLSDRRLSFRNQSQIPAGLMAAALQNKERFYGVLWVAYDQSHSFVETERRFFSTLAAQAAVAATNVNLFEAAEIGRRRLAAILAATPDPVLVADSESRLMLSNPAAWRVFGNALEQGEGKPIASLLNQPLLVEILQAGHKEPRSIELETPDGSIYVAKATSFQTDATQYGRVCALRDVTRLKTLDAQKSEFVSTVSHDLRSPLTLMRGYATMLEMVGDMNGEQVKYVNRIVTGVDNMTRLVNSLLDLGRIEAGVDLNLELVPMVEVFDRVIQRLRPAADQKQITLSFRYPGPSMPLVEADQELIEQALYNLVENAIKYTQEEGRVEVRMRIDGDPRRIFFEVLDNGPGIAPEHLDRVFEKFYRIVDRSNIKQRGSGLGLAIVRSIIEKHGGVVSVESQPGEGSLFRMQFPIKQVQEA